MPSYRDQVVTPESSGLIADLSPLADRLTNYEDIAEHLSEEQERRIVDYIKACMEMSYDRVSRRYPHWRAADAAHDVYVNPDATNFREKIVISDTRAIADTVITYMMAAITGRNPMFQMEGLNRKSRRASAIMERIIHAQMRRYSGEARIAQMFLDSVRYGFAPTKCLWDAKRNTNIVVNANPYRTFTDPRVSSGDVDEMSFIIHTDHTSYDALVQSNLYPKLLRYPALRNEIQRNSANAWNAHKWQQEEGRGLSINPNTDQQRDGERMFRIGRSRLVDEAWLRLSGYQLGLPRLGTIWVVVTILDESVCIRFSLNSYGAVFPWTIGALHRDVHKTFGQSLYDLILPLHDLATWLMRSRYDNVMAAMNNLIFVDPTRVSIADLTHRNGHGIVRTLPGAQPGEGVFIAQIPDVTRGHWNDIAALSDLKQRVTAASDAQQGVPTADVRTATEVQRLTQLGSQRLGVLSRIMSATAIRPLVRMMATNLQDALNFEGSIRLSEDAAAGILRPMIQDDYLDFTMDDLRGEIDYLVVDGTLPIEPTRSPETWLNALTIMNQAGLGQEIDLKKIALEAVRATGVGDVDQFRITPEQQAQGLTPSQQLQMMEKMRGSSVVPEENLMKEVQAGNLVPFRGRAG